MENLAIGLRGVDFMAVDPAKTRKILVVHGVETGTDQDLHLDNDIYELVESRLKGIPLDFSAEMYRYENINDAAQAKLKQVLNIFFQGIIGKAIVDPTIELVGDVVIALKKGSTADTIRQGLVTRILEIFAEGNPLYIVAHSLGSIYAFDAVNQLIGTKAYFNRDDRKTWPVQGLVTMGSPLGLAMFNRKSVTDIGEGRKFLRWINYWDRTDPVVSGSFYGKPQQGYSIVERFASSSPTCGWFIQDRVVDIGKAWLMAHVGYWSHPAIGDDLATLIAA